jgi:hypothetical protein
MTMLYQYIRIIKNKNGTLSDMSLDNQDESSSCLFNLVPNDDYIYIGQQLPFNNFYIKSSVANAVNSVMSIDYWDGNNWRSAVDVIDGTSQTGKTMARSGVIQFSPNHYYRWTRVDDTSEAPSPNDLRTLTIYNLYWVRLKVSASLTNTTATKRVSYCFSSHQQLDNRDHTINAYLASFGVGKTSWEDEIITASIDIVNELKARNLIIESGQILRFENVTVATDWRALMNIYRDLGGDYNNKYEKAKEEMNRALSSKVFTFDKNKDGETQSYEVSENQHGLSR